ncbi:MAG: hypothetical protein K2M25_04265, partial [Muribaculaceae bacterium]|nr:hypothetical protein [Muribaculaceae bacterium]
MNYNRFIRHFTNSLRIAGTTLNILTIIGSLLCIIAMIIYIGFDHSIDETRLIFSLLRTSQIIFILTVGFNIIFNFKDTVRNTRP